MAHLTFHERRILRDLERQLARDPEFVRLLAPLDRQAHPPTAARRTRSVAAVATGCCLIGLALAAAYLWAGWGLLAFTALVLLVCAPPLWVNQRRRAPSAGEGSAGYWRAKRSTPRMWIRWRAHQHLTRPQR